MDILISVFDWVTGVTFFKWLATFGVGRVLKWAAYLVWSSPIIAIVLAMLWFLALEKSDPKPSAGMPSGFDMRNLNNSRNYHLYAFHSAPIDPLSKTAVIWKAKAVAMYGQEVVDEKIQNVVDDHNFIGDCSGGI
jgi:hypothetical protein